MSTPAKTENVPAVLALANQTPQVIGADDSMWLARRLMEEHHLSHLVVMDYFRVIGMLSERDVLRCPSVHAAVEPPTGSCDETPTTVRHWMTPDVVGLNESDSVRIAAATMLEHKVGALPILSARSGLRALITEAELVHYFGRKRTAGDDEAFLPVVNYMSAELIAADPSHTLHDAITMFTDYPIRHLPVVQQGRPIGMLSDAGALAYLARARAENRSPFEAAGVSVTEVMARPVAVMNHLFTVVQAVRMMQQRNVDALPVLQDGHIVGMFTATDVLKLIAH